MPSHQLRRSSPIHLLLPPLLALCLGSAGTPLGAETRQPLGPGRVFEAGPGVRKGPWQVFGHSDGFPPGSVSAIVQDQWGIWFSFAERGPGLVHFDGARFAHYSADDGLPDDLVEDLHLDDRGHLWVATAAGLCRIDSDTVTTYTSADGLADDHVRRIVQDGDGRFWFLTIGGVSTLDGDRWEPHAGPDGFQPGVLAGALAIDQHGHVWLGDARSLYRYDGNTWHTHTPPYTLPADGAWISVLAADDGTIWAGSAPPRLVRLDRAEWSTVLSQDALAGVGIFSLMQASDGNVWVGTNGNGALRYDGAEWHAHGVADGLGNGQVYSMLEDREGALWFGGIAGVSRYDAQQAVSFDTGDGLAHNLVFAAHEDREGTLWLGTLAGLNRYDGTEWATVPLEDSTGGTTVRRIAEDDSGRLWIATSHHVARRDTGGWTRYTKAEMELAHEWGSYVSAVGAGHDGRVWAAGTGGISQYDPSTDTWTAIHPGDRWPYGLAHVFSLLTDDQGALWFAGVGVEEHEGRMLTTGNAQLLVGFLDGEEWRLFGGESGLPGWGIGMSLHQSDDGQIWFGTRSGVFRYDGVAWSAWNEPGGPGEVLTLSITGDAGGRTWIGTFGKGVYITDGAGAIQNLLRADGLPDDLIQSVCHSRSGDVWIGTESGVVRYRPGTTPPSISISEVVADQSYGPAPQIAVPSTQSYLSIRFQGASLRTRPDGMAYHYRLRGHDDTWRQTRDRTVEYGSLRVGGYTFEVKALDRDLNYSPEPARVDIDVYYQPMSTSVQISDLQVRDVFASFYASYADSIGSVTVTNGDASAVEARLAVYIPGVMSQPTERTLLLAPRASVTVPVSAVFDEGILGLESSRPVQARVSLSCQVGDQIVSVTEPCDLMLHRSGALTWDELGRAAAFITPEAQTVVGFARGLVQAYEPLLEARQVDGTIPAAMLLFEALNARGVQYAPDPGTPYSRVRGDRSAVDHIQYPAQLLQSRMGDCDDCTVLYCALLENLGIATALVDAPNHLFMMFDSGVSADVQAYGFSLDEDLFVVRDGRFWIPVEVTVLGEGSFLDAWKLGAQTCARLEAEGLLRVTQVQEAWARHPYAVPPETVDIKLPDPDLVEPRYLEDRKAMRRLRRNHIQREYIRPLLQNPADHSRRLGLARVHLESEEYNEGISALVPLLDTALGADALFLIGYAYVGLEDYEAGVEHMARAAARDPDNQVFQTRLAALREYLRRQ